MATDSTAMIDLTVLIKGVVGGGLDLNEGRRRNVLSHLEDALGPAPSIPREQVCDLQEKLRAHLKGIEGIEASTVRQQVYRLGMLLDLAVAQGLLEAEEVRPTCGFPELPPPKATTDRRRWTAFGAFRDWCIAAKIQYDAVDKEVLVEYREWLKAARVSTGEARYDDLRRFWLESADAALLRPVDIPLFREDARTRYGLPRAAWPGSVECQFAEFERGATGRAREGERRWWKPLKQNSIAFYEKDLSQLLGYLVNVRRIPVGERSLLDLLSDAEAVTEYVEWHVRVRTGGCERQHHVDTLCRLARLLEWLDPTAEEAATYVMMSVSLDPSAARDAFPPEPISHKAFLQAAWSALREAEVQWEKDKRGTRAAQLAAAIKYRDAVMFAFLILRPIREANVLMMEVDRHLKCRGPGSWDIEFEAHEMKGNKPFNSPFPGMLVPWLEVYLTDVRKVLDIEGANKIVFVSRTGRPILPGDIWRRMTAIGQRSLKIHTNPHAFRALVPSAYLLEYPDRVQEVQALLGHAAIETTLKYYIRTYSQLASRKAAGFIRATCPHFALFASAVAAGPTHI